MSFQRSRPVDTLQRIISSFRQFEKKIDKLQDDVNYHGQTLMDLRSMVSNFSAGTTLNPDGKIEEIKRPQKKSTAIQYEIRMHMEEPLKIKRKNAIQPLPSKIKAKSFQTKYFGMKLSSADEPFRMNNISSSPKETGLAKHLRPRKAEAPRKAASLRTQKGLNQKRSKIPKQEIIKAFSKHTN